MDGRILGNLEVAKILEDFLDGTGSQWDWDDFLSRAQVAAPRLKEIQQHVNRISDEYPPEKPGEYCSERGRQRIRQYVEELRRL